PVTPVPIIPPQEHVVAVVDAQGVWPSAGPGGEDVSVVSPADLARRLEELAPGCVVANLAAPGALEALAALRAAGWTTPVRGCLAATAPAVPPRPDNGAHPGKRGHGHRFLRRHDVPDDSRAGNAARPAAGEGARPGEARRERAALVRSHLAACRAGVTRSRSRATASAGAPSRASST